MSLPPLPNPVIPASELVESSSSVFAALYLKEQMQAYGQQCRAEALEEAAQVCDERANGENDAQYCADRIRNLK